MPIARPRFPRFISLEKHRTQAGEWPLTGPRPPGGFQKHSAERRQTQTHSLDLSRQDLPSVLHSRQSDVHPEDFVGPLERRRRDYRLTDTFHAGHWLGVPALAQAVNVEGRVTLLRGPSAMGLKVTREAVAPVKRRQASGVSLPLCVLLYLC